MSEYDSGVEAGARDAAPIVLIIGDRTVQTYLDNNEVLAAIYGNNAPRRVSIPADADYGSVAWELFYPYSDNVESQLKLLRRFDSVPVRELPKFLRSERFYFTIYHYIRQLTGISRQEDAMRVHVIICNKDMLEGVNPMLEVAKRFFPNAVLFTIGRSGHSRPERFVPTEATPAT